MRILGSIDHPKWKITVFKMEDRLTAKLESALYELAFKFRAGEGMDSLEDVRHFMDAGFLEEAERQFEALHQARLRAFSRRSVLSADENFEEII